MNAHIYTHGPNLIDYNATDTNKGFISGKYLNSNGTAQTPGDATVWNVSEYIDVSGISRIRVVITLNSASNPSICYYDDKKEFIRGSSYGARESFAENLPAGTQYIRFSYSENAQTRGWSVYDTALEWRETESYQYTHGPNLFDSNKVVPGMLFLTGEYKTDNPNGCAIYIPVTGGQEYTFAIDVPGSAIPQPGLQSVFSIDEPAGGVSYKINDNTTWVNHGYTNTFTRTAPAAANYMAIQIGSEDNANKSIRIYNPNAALGWNNGTSYKYTSGSWTK